MVFMLKYNYGKQPFNLVSLTYGSTWGLHWVISLLPSSAFASQGTAFHKRESHPYQKATNEKN